MVVRMVVRPTNGCKDGQCEEAGLDIIPIDGKVLDNHVQTLHIITLTRLKHYLNLNNHFGDKVDPLSSGCIGHLFIGCQGNFCLNRSGTEIIDVNDEDGVKVPGSKGPCDEDADDGGAGWQELRERASSARRKVWTRTKILSPNIRYFVAILRFVAIYAFYKAFIEL